MTEKMRGHLLTWYRIMYRDNMRVIRRVLDTKMDGYVGIRRLKKIEGQCERRYVGERYVDYVGVYSEDV